MNLLAVNSVHTLCTDTRVYRSQVAVDTVLESMGVENEEPSVYEKFFSTVSFKDGCYEVHLPWRIWYPKLADNFELSKRRLTGLLHWLRCTPQLLQEYDAIVQDQLCSGIVELVTSETTVRTHYLSHHVVLQTDKSTTKVRIMHDASANDCLHKGPKFHQSIMNIFIRFRTHCITLCADLEKAI